MIEINGLTKIYKMSTKQKQLAKTKRDTKVAVDNLSLTARKGEIFGLLGPNGAGKTTTLRCIATLLKPSEGQVKVAGYDTITEAAEVRKRIAFLTTEIKLDPNFTPRYLFNFFGSLHRVEPDLLEARRRNLFDYFGITDFENKKIDELSSGMKQKAAIAVSLVHDPEIVIFDEPTNGLDIITARSVLEYLKVLRDQGKLVVISTHIMSEAERLCDRLAIIIDGKKVADGTLEEIYTATATDNLEDAFFLLYQREAREME
ncbi:MAG: ABC transporter ATP-binding protein [Peptococcia bacterium]